MSRHRKSSTRLQRSIASFFLFVFVTMLGLSLCGLTFAFNPRSFVDLLTGSSYVTEMHRDVVEYAEDMCDKASLPKDFVKTTIRYSTIREIERAYINSALSTSDNYNEYAYGVLLEQLEADIAHYADETIEKGGLRASPTQKDGSARFARSIAEYLQRRVEFPYMDRLSNMLSKGRSACITVMSLSFLASVGMIVYIFNKNTKIYRKLRNLAVSAASASVLELVLVLAVAIVKATKQLVIYPLYLADAFMHYVNETMAMVGITGAITMLISLALMTAIWSLKRSDKG